MSQGELFENDAAPSTPFSDPHLARQPPSRGSKKGRRMRVGFGQNGIGLFERLDPVGFALRMSLGSLLCQMRPGLSVNWRERVTRSGLIVWELQTLEHPIEGSECGSSEGWPTPSSAKAGNDITLTCSGDGRDQPNLLGWSVAGQAWPTESARDWKSPQASQETLEGNARPLNETVLAERSWMTPTVGDANGRTYQYDNHDKTKPRLALLGQSLGDGQPDLEDNNIPGSLPVSSGLMLSPEWVSQLQGLPSDWCELPTDVLERLYAGRLVSS